MSRLRLPRQLDESVDVYNKVIMYLAQSWNGAYDDTGYFVANVNGYRVEAKATRTRSWYFINENNVEIEDVIKLIKEQDAIKKALNVGAKDAGFTLDI